jgi:hypothetical protein
MAQTSGLVQRIAWFPPVVCTWVGPSAANSELLFTVFQPGDSESLLAFKGSLVKVLVAAKTAGYGVTIGHPDNSGEMETIALQSFDISPVGHAVHRDMYAVSGSSIPPDAEVVFDSALVSVSVVPDLVRPHLVVVADLPDAIPVGRNLVHLEAPGWVSDSVPVEVTPGPPVIARTLYSGRPKTRPYSFVLVANPAIETEAGAFVADSVLTDRATFQDVTAFILRNLFTLTEDVLRLGDWDAEMRLVTVHDAAVLPADASALAHEWPNTNLMETRRVRLNGFLAPYTGRADIVFVVHGSTTHDRATAWFTTDDPSQPSTNYTYDGVARTHGAYPSIPGSAAVPLNMDQTGLTPLHEFGHAAADFNNGRVIDLYVDGLSGFSVNKKARALSTDPIPANFADYDGTQFASDQNRDSIGYGSFTSFHPALIDPNNPNLMDNYWLAPGGDPQVCRLDQLTFEWLTDRLRAKLDR